MELVAAGVEGGSKRAIMDEWTLADVYRLRDHWAEFGPPTHIAVAIFASAWGCKLTRAPDAQKPLIVDGGIVGPSIAELGAMMQVRPGCDTLEASKVITQRILGQDGQPPA